MTDWSPVIVALAVAIPVLAAAVAAWPQGRDNRTAIAAVHKAVADTHAVTVARVEQLEQALTASGMVVPPHPQRRP